MKVAIVIITYNIDSRVFLLQVEAIRKFCKDDFTIEVFDNSFNMALAEGIRYHCERQEIKYTKTTANSKNGSDSHIFAANLSYQVLKNKYDAFIYFDHDLIPVKPFSISEILGDRYIGGLGQGTNTVYFWPGCVMWLNDKVDNELIDFSACNDLCIDTGGMFYKVIEKYGVDNCVFFDEAYCQIDGFSGKEGFFSLINSGMFSHWGGSSNWERNERHMERINALLNITKEEIDKNVD